MVRLVVEVTDQGHSLLRLETGGKAILSLAEFEHILQHSHLARTSHDAHTRPAVGFLHGEVRRYKMLLVELHEAELSNRGQIFIDRLAALAAHAHLARVL